MKQRTKEWLEWRKSKITGTDASIIMGINPYKSVLELLDQKMGFRPPDEINEAMERGTALETKALEAFEELTGHIVFPKVCVGKPDWMVASLDGLSLEEDIAVEIKCLGKKNSEKIFKTKEVPAHYMAQMQHQLAVTGLDKMYFFSYYPEENLNTLIEVKRDQEFIDTLIEKETRFYQILMECKKEHEQFLDLYDSYKDELFMELHAQTEVEYGTD